MQLSQLSSTRKSIRSRITGILVQPFAGAVIAVEVIVSSAAEDAVESIVTIEVVLTRAAKELIDVFAAFEDVVACAAEEGVGSFVAVNGVTMLSAA